MKSLAVLTAAVVLLGLAGAVIAGTLKYGLAEVQRGSVEPALHLRRLIGEASHASKLRRLRFMFFMVDAPQGDTKAVKWYRLMAKQGHPTAQYNLGFMYANGRGVPQNYVQAHKWFNLPASRQAPTSHV